MANAQPDAMGAFLGPDVLAQQYKLQRAQQIAQLLQQNAMQDAQGPAGEMVSGHYVPTYNGLKGLGQAYFAKKAADELPQMQADSSQAQMAAMVRNFGGGGSAAPAGDASSTALAAGSLQGDNGPTNTNAARMDSLTSGQPSQGVIPRLSGMDARGSAMAYMSMGPGEYTKLLASQLAPTDMQKNNQYMGINANEAGTWARNEANVKGVINMRPGQTTGKVDANGNVSPTFTAPDQATGINTTWDNGVPSASAIPGVIKLRSDLAAAELAGKNKQTLAPENSLTRNPDGTYTPASIATVLSGGAQSTTPEVPGNGLDISRLTEKQRTYLQRQDPQAYAAGVARFGASGIKPAGAGAPWGAEEGAKNAQTELTKKWTELTTQNQTAQTTTSYLQSIKELAKKANAGSAVDKYALVNGLLAPFGNERANDELTAKNLLDKYSNQITARLGAGGGIGTDAGRAILQSAYPNAHMQPDAIAEAADNLTGSNEMVKAKTRFLQQHANGRDPVSYSNNEVKFDQAADPRVWQLKNLDAAGQAKFIGKMSPGDAADLLKRIQTLREMKAY